MELWAVLLLALLTETYAADESCVGRCEIGFDSQGTCQCDSMCKYYKSCCSDFEVTCGRITRGDTFVFAEDDDYEELFNSTTSPPGHSAQSVIVSSHQPELTHQHDPDFSQRPQHHPESTLEMTKPPQPIDTLVQTTSVRQMSPTSDTVPPTQRVQIAAAPHKTDAADETTTVSVTTATTEAPDPDAEVCSGRPFDSFMQLKSGSIHAFRGKYFFELDQKSVLPGYPKLIQDVWGISGPIDAAFTRVNCQGKTYIFKENKYWRFDNGVLDDDYPRNISVGFDKIPDHVDAAFALPAASHHGKERVYFFKGDQYYMYEFLHQPSHEECFAMSERSPSTLFRRYTDVYYNNYERVFSELFSDLPQYHDPHHFIDKDWKGFKPPVDAAMAGRIYLSRWRGIPPRRSDYQPDQQWGQQQGQHWNRQYRQQWRQRRQSPYPSWASIAEQGMNVGQNFAEKGMEMGLRLAERRMEMEERLGRDWDRRWDRDWDRRWDRDWDRRWDQDWDRRWDQDWDQDRRRDRYRQNNRGNYDSRDDRSYWDVPQRRLPIQSVYFFKGDKYYRVDLRTKRVDPAMPPYPRSIAKYWLGCSDTTGAEK